MSSSRISRRSVLTGAGAAATTAVLVGPASAFSDPTSPATHHVAVADLERRYGRTIGVYARNLRTGRQLRHQHTTRFAMCSTFKPLAVAALLDGRSSPPDRHILRRRSPYPPSLVDGDVWAPWTRRWLAEEYVPTVGEMCEVAVRDSDNGAANAVVQHLGGPRAVTSWLGSAGDHQTRLDRWEPEMSAAEPGDRRDTSTPHALASTVSGLLVGRVLDRSASAQLRHWMLGSRTGSPFRRSLPPGWSLADKTGSGSYATRNDVGIAWSPQGAPIVISCMTRGASVDDQRIDAPLVDVFALCLEELR